MIYRILKTIVTASMVALIVSACSGGSEGSGISAPVKLQGTVTAPGGAIAFNQPGILKRLFASIFGNNAMAAIDGVANVGAGVSVNLIEVDASGNQVGAVIASGTTDASGAFSIDAPESFTAGSQYVVRAAGSSENIDARVASTTVDVNPITDAASDLVTTKVDNLDKISTVELDEIAKTLDDLSKDIDPAGLSADSLSTALQTEAVNDDESDNVITSSAAAGQICGKVSNSSGAGLANIRIIARDYQDWVTRSKTTTASDGSYCLNVPRLGDPDPDTGGTFSGNYILGAINYTGDGNDPNRSASEWWSASGDAYTQFGGDKISVTDTTTVVKNFQLENGARISGTITEENTGNLIEGVRVVFRSFESLAPVSSARAKADGTFRINLIPGTYYVEARNTTSQAYASEVYDGANGSNNANHGIPVILTAGLNKTINFSLGTGHKLSGTISDGVGGNAVAGHRIMINLTAGGSSFRIRSNKQGNYRIWVQPDTYNIYAYGQRSVGVNLTAANQTADFTSADVSAVTATILSNGKPVTQAKVRLYDTTGAFINMEPSNSDGTVVIYTAGTGNYLIETRIDRQDIFGTLIYQNNTRLLSGQLINVASISSTVAVGDITLPAAGVLTGKVTSDGVAPIANFRVQVRDDNDLTGTSGGVTSADAFTSMRTRGDGSFVVSLPAGVYDRVKMQDASLGVVNDNGNCDSITIVAGATTTVNYNDQTDTCSF